MAARPPDHLVGVVGSPIDHSLSPVIHQAAFNELGLNWTSCRFDVGSGDGADVIAAMRTLGIRGLSVTMPLKAEMAELVDELDQSAETLRSVNTLVGDEGSISGFSTDGAGLFASLERSHGVAVAGQRVMVLGAGGAARSVAAYAGANGAGEVAVVARRSSAAEETAMVAGGVGRVADGVEAPLFDLVVNATSIGMAGTSNESATPLVDASLLRPGQLAVDLVYRPMRTSWLAAAGAAGAMTEGGLGMLVHQAALALEIWTRMEAPIDAMLVAVASAVASAVEEPSW